MKPIPYGRHSISDQDIEEVVKVLKSDFLTQGPKVNEFEEKFAKYIGCKYAVAVANGTAALHLSVLALNVKPGDKVITTPITFAATANCIRYAGGEVIFADIDPETYLLDINKVEDILRKEKSIKGIIPVDFAGYPVNLEEYRTLADRYNLWILEDACHAPGGYFYSSDGEKQKCGNSNYAELSVFSFHPVKHIATGEGGIIVTNNKDLYKRLKLLRTHGITKDPEILVENHGSWYYEMHELGFNYRMTDIQAALGKSQLNRAEINLDKRKKIAAKYFNAFKNSEFVRGQSGVVDGHAYHLYILQVEQRKDLYDYLRENKIYVQVHYIPLHLMPYYRDFGWKEGDFPNAENYYKHCISIPIYPTLTDEEQDFVIQKIKDFYK